MVKELQSFRTTKRFNSLKEAQKNYTRSARKCSPRKKMAEQNATACSETPEVAPPVEEVTDSELQFLIFRRSSTNSRRFKTNQKIGNKGYEIATTGSLMEETIAEINQTDFPTKMITDFVAGQKAR